MKMKPGACAHAGQGEGAVPGGGGGGGGTPPGWQREGKQSIRASPAGLLPLSVMALSLVSLPATLQCALPVEKSL